ncbi:ribonuclease J [Mycobacterium sp. ITM-2016-00316]|nr:ribonuclease J [Mycobacterium sp. ITM-2016-00316]WNG84879.1 ribonuclease J [Mycobacterium sp. ITM-2016-00316]
MLPKTLRLFAGGGLGEIGRNMTVFEYEGVSFVLDMGVLFPSTYTPGVDLILPDLEIFERANVSPSWVVLTHGHEDHIGALPYFVRSFPNVTIVGTQLTLALARGRLSEHGLNPPMKEISGGDTVDLGPFALTFVPVAHSVPDGIGLLMRVGELTVVHTGDFKVDATVLDGRNTVLERFLPSDGGPVDLLLSDSTNAEVTARVAGEGDITETLQSEFQSTAGKLVFACFASNIHRVQQAVDLAVADGRKVCFIGRSMVRNMGIAQELGYLKIPSGAEISYQECAAHPPRELAIICTGSQGEPLSALARISRGEHQIKVSSDDTVLLSARLIPGNETDIFQVVNALSRRGVRVHTRDTSKIHASGHAPAPDLEDLIRLLRPKCFVPVHGEWRHLQAHARIAERALVGQVNVIVLANGDALDLQSTTSRVSGTYGHRDLYLDGSTVGHIERSIFRERARMSDGGTVQIIVPIDSGSRQLVAEPVVSFFGISEDNDLWVRCVELAKVEIAKANGKVDSLKLEMRVTQSVRQFIKHEYRSKPLVATTVIELKQSGE